MDVMRCSQKLPRRSTQSCPFCRASKRDQKTGPRKQFSHTINPWLSLCGLVAQLAHDDTPRPRGAVVGFGGSNGREAGLFVEPFVLVRIEADTDGRVEEEKGADEK